MLDWPEWWHWELQLSDHLLFRMPQRNFNEVELRAMLADADSVHPDKEPGRWFVEVPFRGTPWKIILEPDFTERILIVITAYKID